MTARGGILLALLARIPATGTSAFDAYESQVLALLADHGGTLQRRLRTADGQTEIHVVWFPSDSALAAYREDPRRAALAPLLAASGAVTELFRVVDV
jgi:uncharacterized protein (DUF1330 family)